MGKFLQFFGINGKKEGPPSPPIVETPRIVPNYLAILSPQEKEQIRAILNSPVYVKFLSVVALKKPSSACKNTGSQERDEFSDARANARLGEIRGWEYYETAMFLALNTPPSTREVLTEDFPDTGLLISANKEITTKRRK